ncbi:MAG: methyltransferase domain-containing protein [Leptolyngbya sp. SIO3F4]|nr:methyltransferase domain-containing protein [Leptolyngbya sp. SIO3F4]
MTELELLLDLFKNTERQGPGSPEDTRRALSFVELPSDEQLQVADIGCGSGGQTLTLAEHLSGNITAVDLFPSLLDELNDQVWAKGLENRIQTRSESMENLSFESGSLDLIWSEGAIYNMGFENGIRQWKQYLKPQGYLAVSELTWITPERPAEIEKYWTQEYPEIDTAAIKIRLLEKHGYTLTGYFHLPRESWWEHYYMPLQACFAPFLERQAHTEAARNIVAEHQQEIELFEKYHAYFSYGFYIARNNE